MLNDEILKLDKIDRTIMFLLQDNSSITHSLIAKQLGRSQPAIGARIKKLNDLGLIVQQMGVDFSQEDIMANLHLAFVTVESNDAKKMFEVANKCPYVINTFKLTANKNFILLMACSNLKRLDYILDKYIRTQPFVRCIEMNLISKIASPLVLPLDLEDETFETFNEDIPTRKKRGIFNLIINKKPLLDAIKKKKKH